MRRALDWLADRQITDVVGDWASTRPSLAPGGWAFQYWNDYYPDVDDTAVLAIAVRGGGGSAHQAGLDKTITLGGGMQSGDRRAGALRPRETHFHPQQLSLRHPPPLL